jgi:hypothetical protein
MAAKTTSKTPKTKPRNRVKVSAVTQPPTYAELRQQLAESLEREKATGEELQVCKHQLTEALEHQTATSEVLGIISCSPTDVQPVLDTIAQSAARVCNANDATIRLVEEEMLRLAAHYGPIPMFAASKLPIDRDSVAGRAVLERHRIHIDDLLSITATEFPRTRGTTELEGNRTVLVVSLMRENAPVWHDYDSPNRSPALYG